jgi:hypothetical protein
LAVHRQDLSFSRRICRKCDEKDDMMGKDAMVKDRMAKDGMGKGKMSQ